MVMRAQAGGPVSRWLEGERDLFLRRLIRTCRVDTGLLRRSLRRRGRFGVQTRVHYARYVRTDRAGRPFPDDALARTLASGSLARLRRILAQAGQPQLRAALAERQVRGIVLGFYEPAVSRRAARAQAARRRSLRRQGRVLGPPRWTLG